MKLYYAPGACSLASHVILEESGARFEAVRVNLREGEQRKPDYLKINAKGKVPALALDGGEILTENPVIMGYVAESHPQAGLLAPVGDLKRLRAQEWLAWGASTIQPSFGPLFHSRRVSDAEEGKALAAKGAATVQPLLDTFDRWLEGKSFVLGDQLSIADGYTLVFYNWAKNFGLTIGKSHHHSVEKLLARPAVQRALQTEGLQIHA